MLSGRSGIGPITAFEQDDEWTVRFAGEVDDLDTSHCVDGREAKRMDRACLLGLVAAEEAAKDSGIDFQTGDHSRRGVAIVRPVARPRRAPTPGHSKSTGARHALEGSSSEHKR